MQWGLLAGIGKGLSQGADIVNRGMAEDRAAAREQARFDESRRWQQAMENKRIAERAEDRDVRKSERAEDMQFRQSESNRQAGQFDRQMSVREKQVIEGNLNGIMEQEARAAEKIRAAYAKRLESGMGDPAALNAELDAELLANQEFYSGRLHNMIQSYGDQLRGTGFEYLLDFESAETEQPEPVLTTEKQAKPAQRDISQYVSKIVQPEASAGTGLMNINPSYTTDSTGNPELSFSNLMRKWNTPSPDSPALPRAKTAEQIEEEKRNLERVKSSGITSAYGAAMMNQGRN